MEKERKQKPRGIRNNNPLNIVQTKDKWQGLREKQYDKRFCEFIDMAHGYRAAFIILKNYIKKHGWVTIEQIVSHWAPKNENDTAVYIFAVCNFMDVKKDHVMDFGNMPDMLMLVSAMTVVENGSYYNPQKLYYDLWRPMYEGYKMAFGSRKNLAALEYSPDDAEKKRIEAARKAIREAYWRNWAALPSVWVARDADNSLWIYTTKPVKSDGMFHCSATGDMFQIDDSVYPEITFENSPIRVKLLFIDA